MTKKRGERVPVMAYFDPNEIPLLERAMKKAKRDASSLMRWLVEEFAEDRLIQAQQAQLQKLQSDIERVQQDLERRLQAIAADLERVQGKAADLTNAVESSGSRVTVTNRIDEIGDIESTSDRPLKESKRPR